MIWLHTQFWTAVDVLALPWRFWGFTWLSVASDMTYLLGLIYAYRKMEISTAYPMMRALPLPLTALLTLLFGIGDKLSALALAGMAIVFMGCLLIPLKRLSDFSLRNYLNRSMIFILVVACGTTGYTLCDKLSQGGDGVSGGRFAQADGGVDLLLDPWYLSGVGVAAGNFECTVDPSGFL